MSKDRMKLLRHGLKAEKYVKICECLLLMRTIIILGL